MKRCELTKVEMTKDRVDHKPTMFVSEVSFQLHIRVKHASQISFNPSHAAIKISINATAAEFICKNIFPTPVQIKKIMKNKIGDIQQIYLYPGLQKFLNPNRSARPMTSSTSYEHEFDNPK